MNKFLIASVIVMITPFLGIPLNWKTIILFSVGVFIAFYSIREQKNYNRHKEQVREETLERVFVENEKESTEE